ncbi:MAG: DNA alkylation repair protein [Lachnospiraceae bacterium]|nr:DNA alkylation repair protein [Lachnospiraceae bacterium]
MTREDITKGLQELQDEEYRAFHAKLMPEIEYERIIGVRTPQLRAYAKQIAGEPCVEEFLQELPHYYYEENNLHGALLNLQYKKETELGELLEQLERFLPYVDNWATCDMLSPKLFKKNLPLVYERIKEWVKSEDTYTIRFGIVTLLGYFLDDAFVPEMLELAAGVESEEYYVKMAVAWYFSIALVKQYAVTVPYFEQPRLEPWTHNKAIQKAIESRRIDEEVKDYLRTLKVKSKS